MKEINERKIAQLITSLTAVVAKTTCASNEFPEKITQLPSMRKLPHAPQSPHYYDPAVSTHPH